MGIEALGESLLASAKKKSKKQERKAKVFTGLMLGIQAGNHILRKRAEKRAKEFWSGNQGLLDARASQFDKGVTFWKEHGNMAKTYGITGVDDWEDAKRQELYKVYRDRELAGGTIKDIDAFKQSVNPKIEDDINAYRQKVELYKDFRNIGRTETELTSSKTNFIKPLKDKLDKAAKTIESESSVGGYLLNGLGFGDRQRVILEQQQILGSSALLPKGYDVSGIQKDIEENNKFIEELSDINSKVVYEPMTKEERIKVLGTTSTSSQAVATHRSSLLTALSFEPDIRAKSTLTEYTFTLPAGKDTRVFKTPVNIRQAYEMIQKGQGQAAATNFVSSILTYSKRAKEDFEKTNVGGDVQAAEYYLEIGIRKAIENNFKVNGETPEKELTYDPERKVTVEFKDSNNNVILTMSEIKLGALEKQFNSYKTKEEAKQLLDAVKNSNVQSLSPVFVDMLEDMYNQKFSQDN